MRHMQLALAACLALCCAQVQADDTAYTVRPTALKARPFSDAETLANLPEKGRVEIIARRGSWYQIKASGKTGWVKMLSLRLGAGGPGKGGDSGVGTLFNLASTGSSGSTTTTGVRGLSEEKLHNPQPNPQGLKQLGGFATNKADAQQYAQSANLQATQMDYLPAPSK